jgi:hypothetical protein
MPTGACLCGNIRYEIDGELFGIWFCHCSKCRRSTGAAFVAAAACRKQDFRWLEEPQTIAEFRTESGYRRSFCSTCGSPIPLTLTDTDTGADTDFVWLPVGGFDDDPGIRPLRHIFVGSKAPWFEISDALPQFDEHAPRSR